MTIKINPKIPIPKTNKLSLKTQIQNEGQGDEMVEEEVDDEPPQSKFSTTQIKPTMNIEEEASQEISNNQDNVTKFLEQVNSVR
mgnify:CR=1 FL=1